jgi:N-acetyl-gamma-glutamyl-phosphate reductase
MDTKKGIKGIHMNHESNDLPIKVGIVGGTGYTGVELLRLLSSHPHAALHVITSRTEAGMPVAQMFPSLRGIVDLVFSAPDDVLLFECDVVFFATPHGVAMGQAPALIAQGVRVIDLGADFRLQNTAEFEHWYKLVHTCPDILAQAVYGLTELNREAIAAARLIANPGCYPTTIQLGLYPVLKQGLIEVDSIIADCKSGVSGAGRKAEVATLFSEAADNFKAYGVSGHRHLPETVAQLQGMCSDHVAAQLHLTFVPHLVPMIRGMHSTLYVRLNAKGQTLSDVQLQTVFEAEYAQAHFVDVMPWGSQPETRSVRGSNYLRIGVHRHGAQLIVLVVQDNVVKGASGQAVQNMNVMFGLPEYLGLQQVALLP